MDGCERLSFTSKEREGCIVPLVFLFFYVMLAWVVSGGEVWWILDIINGSNVFYGDDAYRFFLARSAWLDPSLYTYNFILPAALVLDGIVVTVAQGDLFLSRSIHAVLSATALFLVWDSGRALGIRRVVMIAAVIILGLIPRYAFTMLSFYGEAWAVFLVCLLMWLFVRSHFLTLSVIAGLLPLVRPEGIYFLFFVFFKMLIERRWREAIISLIPGGLYFFFLILTLPELTDYSYWRVELRKILEKIPFNRSDWEIFDTYTWMLTLPAALGVLYRPARAAWPIIAPALTWVIVIQGLVLLGLSNYEERYTLTSLPAIILLWAAAITWFSSHAMKYFPSKRFRGLAFSILLCSVLIQGSLQINFLNMKLHHNGAPWLVSKLLSGQWHEIFIHHDLQAMSARKKMAAKIEGLLLADPNINMLVVQDPFLYYFLDPGRIPKHVTIGYPATTYMVFHLLLDGQIFIQHSREKKYSYLRYGLPDFRQGESRALYVDLMPMEGYPYVWRFDGILYELYLLSYIETLSPELNIQSLPALTDGQIRRAWQEWEKMSL